MANAGTLLTTKLFAPPRRANRVARTRLLERMTNARVAGQKILLVSAPAGFGKTTLVSEWCHSQDAAVAWVALDAADNDPVRFFAYLIAALNPLAPEIFSRLAFVNAGAQPPPPETLTAQLLNALSESALPVTIVLDDYHLVENVALHNALELLAAQAPPHVTLVLTTRSDPPLSLARWRARGLLAETRADDLRFTPDEAAEFLNRAANLNLTVTDIAALEERTEGWIAGLQLAALALEHTKDPRAFISAFTGSHRFVLDYLMEEVLQQQSEMVQRFLLQTSILERFNAALCAAILENERGAAQTILQQLERANLFLIPLDETREWFRYHHLFADVLQNRLKQTNAAGVTMLHARAGEWFAQHGFVNEGVTHLLAAGAWERAAGLLDAHLQEWLRRGEYVLLGEWLKALPTHILHTHLQLALARASLEIAANRLDAAQDMLDDVETRSSPAPRALHGEILARRAAIAHFRNQPETSLALAHAALDALPPDAKRLRTETLFFAGLGYGTLGRLAEMLDAMSRVAELGRAAADHYHVLYAEFQIGAIHFSTARLHRAAETYRNAIEYAQTHGVAEMMLVGWLYSELSGVLFEWDEVEPARDAAARALAYGQRGAMPRMQVVALSRQLEIALGLQELDAAERQLHDAEALIRQFQLSARYEGMIQAKRVQWWLALKQLAPARSWAREFEAQLTDTISYVREAESLALARVYLAEEDYARALGILERLIATAAAAGRRGDTFLFDLVRACIYAAQGDSARAQTLAAALVTETAPEKYTRLFVSEGESVRASLLALRARWKNETVSPDIRAHLDHILAAFPSLAPKVPAPVSVRYPALIEPLTARELQMLQLLAKGYSDREISAHLHISSATVKKHLANLFGKLDVHSRTQALARAREIGLL